ncbi:cysteine-rich receptor-like protein kinase 10 [Syzygium oleosum]|uniref:cysteine-rich receptor-like protein kinase 10 n=1 Tax=Syzygium oleosum TaxID=219896 RepID=UPI0024B8EC1C|nr:cysteine-rich receptor-like protein kinase 10 [Syzygium oleosum]
MQNITMDSLQLIFLLCLFQVFYFKKCQNQSFPSCNSGINFTSGSIFPVNLNLTLASLFANAPLNGFATSSFGQDPNTVYGLLQCRAYVTKEECQTCAETSVRAIRQLCPNQKEASILSIDCSLKYSNHSFFSTADSALIIYITNRANASQPALFQSALGNLMLNLSSSAILSPSRLVNQSSAYMDSKTIYAMVQCTPTLEVSSCLKCLQDVIASLSIVCNASEGCRMSSLSCDLRYEMYPFSLTYSPTPAPSPPSSTTNSISPSSSGVFYHVASKKKRTIILVAVPVAAAAVVLMITCSYCFWRKAPKKVLEGDHNPDKSIRSNESLVISLRKLKEATRDFSEEYKLGEGGFGSVYKGRLSDGQEIAVKRLSSSSAQGLEELKTEVLLVAKLLHRNLVRLLGFCLEEDEKLLVYEFLPNGSLDKILFDQIKRFSLEWERRYRIIVGIARGLLYLHEDSQLRIIHRDLKASNILLDENMNPKIADFGLAKLFFGSQTQGNTMRIAGTYGYMAPEYVQHGHFSTKSDVYSFGVLVLEIVTGRKNSSSLNPANLQSHAWQHWANGTALELLDPTAGDQFPRYEVLKCIQIGLMCVQDGPADRPSMSEVIMMLSSYTISSPAPARPAFYVPMEKQEPGSAKGNSNSSSSDQFKTSSVQGSVNEFKMGMPRTFLMSLLFATVLVEATATNYVVGGLNGGWDMNTDQTTWASSQTFLVGDNLIFQYSPGHDVTEVTKGDYDSCQVTSPIQTYTSGSTVIPLTSPGKKYFICSSPGHCAAGMKLQINTLTASSTTSQSPATLPTLGPVSAPLPATVVGPVLPSAPEASSPLMTSPSESIPASSPEVFITPPSHVSAESVTSSATEGSFPSTLAVGLSFFSVLLIAQKAS